MSFYVKDIASFTLGSCLYPKPKIKLRHAGYDRDFNGNEVGAT